MPLIVNPKGRTVAVSRSHYNSLLGQNGWSTTPDECTPKPGGRLSADDSLQQLRGSMVGRPAIVLGKGPSLRELDHDWLDDMVVFGVNDTCRWVDPDVLVWLDPGVYRRHRRLIDACRAQTWSVSASDGARFTFELAGDYGFDGRHIYHGYTSAFVALQLAWIAGCEPIYLAGVDLRPDNDGRHYWDGSQPEDPDARRQLKKMYRGFELAAEAADRHSRHIYRISSFSKLPGLPVRQPVPRRWPTLGFDLAWPHFYPHFKPLIDAWPGRSVVLYHDDGRGAYTSELSAYDNLDLPEAPRPLSEAPGLGVEALVIGSASCARNLPVELPVVRVGHGLGEKNRCLYNVLNMTARGILVPGLRHLHEIHRLMPGYPRHRLHVVGEPKLDDLLSRGPTGPVHTGCPGTVLYSTTWTENDCTLPWAMPILQALRRRGHRVLVTWHHLVGRTTVYRQACQHIRRAGFEVAGPMQVPAFMQRADVILGANSSVVWEFACQHRPVVFLLSPRARRTPGTLDWDWQDAGPSVDVRQVDEVVQATERCIDNPEHYLDRLVDYTDRLVLAKDGHAASRAVRALALMLANT